MLSTATYWLQDMGADGFRLDAVKYLIEDDAVLENTAATFDFWSRFRSHLDAVAPEAFTVGEAWDQTNIVLEYIDAGLHTCFEFDLASATIDRRATRPARIWLASKITDVADDYPFQQYSLS